MFYRFPPPAIPPVIILPDLMVDSLTISIVAYAISISMSKIFAIKYNYKLDPNQELIAQVNTKHTVHNL